MTSAWWTCIEGAKPVIQTHSALHEGSKQKQWGWGCKSQIAKSWQWQVSMSTMPHSMGCIRRNAPHAINVCFEYGRLPCFHFTSSGTMSHTYLLAGSHLQCGGSMHGIRCKLRRRWVKDVYGRLSKLFTVNDPSEVIGH